MQPITDAMQLFRHQRAVRAFSDRPVTAEDLRTVLETEARLEPQRQKPTFEVGERYQIVDKTSEAARLALTTDAIARA